MRRANSANLLNTLGVEHELRQHRVNLRKHVTARLILELPHEFL
jgi:hypothetical protein